MLAILQFQQQQKLMDKMVSMATNPAMADRITDTALKIKRDDPSLSYEEAGKAARKLLGIED